jgi:2,5-diketo-D-gluconate reductase A
MILPMDIRIGAEGARFGLPFTRRGIVPESCASWFLPRIVGIATAVDWCVTGWLFPASEALAAGLVREDVFVTTKLWNDHQGYQEAKDALRDSLGRLEMTHVDLYLIHWPAPALDKYVDTWKAFVELQQEGLARSIGVSNFQVAHLERLAAETETVPVVNQIEAHPYFQNNDVRTHGEARGVATEAWSPIAQGKVLDDPAIVAIADELGRTPAQVVLRWHIQRDSIVFPKSTTPARIEENIRLFDFELNADHAAKIDALNRGEAGRQGPNPDTMAYVPR